MHRVPNGLISHVPTFLRLFVRVEKLETPPRGIAWATESNLFVLSSADLWLQYPLFSLLESFECVRSDEHISYGSDGTTVPPFGCTFSTGEPGSLEYY